MNIRQLEAFRAVMLAGSTVGAAQLLHTSQPAVSRLIHQLEAALQMPLFDRTSGRLVPTVEAGLLYTEVERTFQSVDKIREIARDIRAADAGSLSIASLPLLGLGFIPAAIQEFKSIHPRTNITLKLLPSPKVEEAVAIQNVDFGFAEYPFEASSFERPGLEVEEFCRVFHRLGVPVEHPLARREVVRPEDLAGERFVSLSRETVGRMKVDLLFDRAGVQREMSLDTQVMNVVAKFIIRGLGVGLVDPFTAADFADRGLATVPFEPDVDLHVGLLYPSHRPMSRIAREFVALLRRRKRELLTLFHQQERS
jgi:DNA-binding transcriptional LysR family regulator